MKRMNLCLKRIADFVCDTDVAAGQNLLLTLCPTYPPLNLMHQIAWVLERESESHFFHQACASQLKGWCLVLKDCGLVFLGGWRGPCDVQVFWVGSLTLVFLLSCGATERRSCLRRSGSETAACEQVSGYVYV